MEFHSLPALSEGGHEEDSPVDPVVVWDVMLVAVLVNHVGQMCLGSWLLM